MLWEALGGIYPNYIIPSPGPLGTNEHAGANRAGPICHVPKGPNVGADFHHHVVRKNKSLKR